MKKGIYLLLAVLISTVCLGQTKKTNVSNSKEMERDVNFRCDSLSRVYKVNVVSYKTVNRNGVMKHFICYYGKGELLEKEIPKPVK